MITTPTFNIRDIIKSDKDIIFKWYKTIEETYFLLNNLGALSDPGRRELIIETKDETPVGLIKFESINKTGKKAEVYLSICEKKLAPRNLVCEIINVVTANLFRKENIDNITAYLLENEEEYKRAFESGGFEVAGILREHFFFKGKYHNLVLLQCLKE